MKTAPLAARPREPFVRRGARLLSDVPAGTHATVTAIVAEDREALAEVGIGEGTTVNVERALPLGGPLVIEVGRARVAVARAVARRTAVATNGEPS